MEIVIILLFHSMILLPVDPSAYCDISNIIIVCTLWVKILLTDTGSLYMGLLLKTFDEN